jgi:hypothetical protein
MHEILCSHAALWMPMYLQSLKACMSLRYWPPLLGNPPKVMYVDLGKAAWGGCCFLVISNWLKLNWQHSDSAIVRTQQVGAECDRLIVVH